MHYRCTKAALTSPQCGLWTKGQIEEKKKRFICVDVALWLCGKQAHLGEQHVTTGASIT